jgi:hypothetical protein
MSLEDLADIPTLGEYTAISGSKTTTYSKIGSVGEGIVKNFSGEYERDRAKAQHEANAAQQRQAESEAQRARISQQREARIRRAQVLASTGISGSSGTAGAIASIGSQEANNISTINQNLSFSAEISAANQNAADASGASALASAQFGAGVSIFSAGFPGGLKTIFSEEIKPAKDSQTKP